jgi:mRNA interferase YafQ
VYTVAYTTQFRREYKLALRRGQKEALIQKVITLIATKTPLPAKYKAHKLSGDYKDCWECHVLPDWLLIWRINEQANTLVLIRTGTHSDLF